MSALLIDYNSKCECDECKGECYNGVWGIERVSEAKPDEFVVQMQYDKTRFVITPCPHFAKRVQANNEFVGKWNEWGKQQKNDSAYLGNNPILNDYFLNMVSHSYSPNTPPGEWLENPDNFSLIRDYLFMSGSGPKSDAANLILYGNHPDKIPLKGPFKGVFDKNDKLLEELAIKN